jgi:hypothetical protein
MEQGRFWIKDIESRAVFGLHPIVILPLQSLLGQKRAVPQTSSRTEIDCGKWM